MGPEEVEYEILDNFEETVNIILSYSLVTNLIIFFDSNYFCSNKISIIWEGDYWDCFIFCGLILQHWVTQRFYNEKNPIQVFFKVFFIEYQRYTKIPKYFLWFQWGKKHYFKNCWVQIQQKNNKVKFQLQY